MKQIVLVFISLLLLSCAEQAARRPVSKASGSFMKESIERNKKIIKEEEELIAQVISKDSRNKYISTPYGFWMSYLIKKDEELSLANKGDKIIYSKEVTDLNGNEIYPSKTFEYFTDQQEIIIGLRNGLKLLKEGEKARFMFTSQQAYGYIGDHDKIGINTPISVTITIDKIIEK